jgi:hypothetical protein
MALFQHGALPNAQEITESGKADFHTSERPLRSRPQRLQSYVFGIRVVFDVLGWWFDVFDVCASPTVKRVD